MFKFKEHPYNLLLLTAIILSFLFAFNQIAGINFHDSISLIPIVIILWALPIILALFWILYLTTRKFLYSTTLARAHIFITIFTAAFIVTVLYCGINPFQPMGHRYYYDFTKMDNYKLVGRTIQVVFIILSVGQCTYVANILLGLFFRKRVNK
jgi:hypothetical protein